MSGKDERKWNYRCPKCGGRESIALYANDLAGWIVHGGSRIKSLGFDVLTASSFNSEEKIVTAKCARCGLLDENVQKNAIEFFRESIRTERHISWNSYYALVARGTG
jgi:ribosomal protein L37E